MRRSVLVPAFALLVSLSAGTAHAQYDNRGSTVITSPALGGGTSSPNQYQPQNQTQYHSVQSQPVSPSQALRLDDRVDQLEELVRQLTGKVEEANFKAAQTAKQLERLQADMDLRFKELQTSGAAQPGQAPAQLSMPAAGAGAAPTLTPSKGADAPGPASGPQTLGTIPDKDLKKALAPQPAVPVKTDPQSVYDAAYAAAQAGDYAAAEKGFQDFLDKNPNHQLAGNAQYWMGDIAYSKKDFGTAAATFLDAYKKYPKHTKAPDMIYKAGSSFGLLGKKKEACTAFAILFADQPNMPDRVKRAATAEKKKYDCK